VTSTAPHQALYRRWRAQTFSEIVGRLPAETVEIRGHLMDSGILSRVLTDIRKHLELVRDVSAAEPYVFTEEGKARIAVVEHPLGGAREADVVDRAERVVDEVLSLLMGDR